MWKCCTLRYPKVLSNSQPVERRHLAVHHFRNKDNEFIISSPHRHKFWITISPTSSEFKVLSTDIWENSSTDLPDAERTARISHLNLRFTNLKSILITSCHLHFQIYTMLADYNYMHFLTVRFLLVLVVSVLTTYVENREESLSFNFLWCVFQIVGFLPEEVFYVCRPLCVFRLRGGVMARPTALMDLMRTWANPLSAQVRYIYISIIIYMLQPNFRSWPILRWAWPNLRSEVG